MKKFKSTTGFTLIELLVVIGILGTLASALVATIDPFEQLKKAQDSNTKNVMVEFINGNMRFYTTHNAFPWSSDSGLATPCNGTVDLASLRLSDGTTASDCVDALIDDKELKAAFNTAHSQLKEIYTTYSASTNELVGCFKPQSKSQQNDQNTKYNQDGTENATKDCTSVAVDNGCYWCTR